MSDLLKSFPIFLSALIAYWWMLVPGIVLSLIEIARTVSDKADSLASDKKRIRQYIVPVSIIGLFIASYLAWNNEYQELVKKQNELKKIPEPQLSLKIETLRLFYKSNDQTAVAIVSSISNTGAPSIAESFFLVVKIVGGNMYRVRPTTFKEGITLRDKDGEIIYAPSPEDVLWDKTMPIPILTGAKVVGYLMFFFDVDRGEMEQDGNKFILSCKDVYGTQISSTLIFDKKRHIDRNIHFPGMKFPE